MKEYTKEKETGMFDAAQDLYDVIKTRLVSRESSKLEHGDVEALLDREGKGSEESEAWVTQKALRVLRADASQVAARMRRRATKGALPDKNRNPIDACAKYLLNHRDNLHYNQHLVAGMPMATDVIEGACRHLLKGRMADATGARWRLRGAEAVLKLRALRSSGYFNDYRRFYKEREHFHNHASRYTVEVDHAA